MSKRPDKKTVLITGAGGFLGSELIRQLSCKEDFNVFALTSEKEKLKNRFSESNKLSAYSLQDWEKQQVPLKKVDTVIHCAFSRSEEGKSLAKSLEFTYDVLDQSCKAGVASFINISSRSVYGQNKDLPWTVKTTPSPCSLYGLAKYASELLTTGQSSRGTLQTTNIRLAGLVGPELMERVISIFVRKVVNKEKIKIIGGRQQFSFLDVRDAASGIISLKCNTNPMLWRDAYNLGPVCTYTIIELATLVNEVAVEYSIEPVPIQIKRQEVNLYDRMDSDQFYSDTNWAPTFSMKHTIRTLFEYEIPPQKNED